MDGNHYMMWLTRIFENSRHKISLLLQYYKNPEDIWKASRESLRRVAGIGDISADIICRYRDERVLVGWIQEMEDLKINYYSMYHEAYPKPLKNIYDPPFGLYVKGNLSKGNQHKIAIVGARRCSEYGRTCGFKLAKELGRRGICIVSGMASGIDSSAHRGALMSGSPTIAVLGCGLDICYPKENKNLMQGIIEHGCLLSEYPPGAPPLAHHFPQRNRIISGLSKGVIVVEAGKRSGSLITADFALEQGKEVFAVPGNITSPVSEGTNSLIADGASPISSLEKPEDILYALGIEFTNDEPDNREAVCNIPLAREEKTVYDCINCEPITIYGLMQRLKLPVSDLQYLLSMLELKGYIEKLPGERYRKAL